MDLSAFGGIEERDWETTTDVATLRLAVVGLGGFARNRALPAIAESSYCTTAAVVSGDPQKADAVAAEYNVERTLDYDEYTDGVGTDDYDAVYVCTPNALHEAHVTAAAEHGNAVICEKPLGADVDETAAIVEACERAGVPLMTAYRMQTEPIVRRMREVIRDGLIGDVVKVHGEFSIDVVAGGGEDQWRLDADLAGGGSLMDVGVYPINATRFLIDAEPLAISGTTASTGDPFDEVEEHVAAWMTFEGPEQPAGVFTASYDAHLEDTLQILGTDGQLRLEHAFGTETTRQLTIERGEERATYESPPVNEIAEEFDYFAHAVETGADIEPDGHDGLRDVEAMMAIYESARTGETIRL